VHVYPDTVLHSVVPIGSYPVLEYVDAAETERRLTDAQIRIAPAHTLPVFREPPMTRPIPVLH
jgi:Icc protein